MSVLSSMHLIIFPAIQVKGKSDDWLRNGLSDTSVGRPFLPPFSPCTTTLPQKWKRGSGCATQGSSDASTIQTLKAETPRNQSIASTYVAILRMPTELRLIWAYLGYGYGCPSNSYGRTTAMGTGALQLWLRVYYDYDYRRTTTTATAY